MLTRANPLIVLNFIISRQIVLRCSNCIASTHQARQDGIQLRQARVIDYERATAFAT